MEDSTRQGDSVTDVEGSPQEPADADGNRVHDDHDSDETTTAVQDEPLSDDDLRVGPEKEDEPDTFDRAYVEKLRQENGRYRQRAQRADELAHRLHRALVEQTGRLQDPSDLPFDEDHLGGADKMVAAIDELLTAKPHLAARRVTGDVGQGASKPSDGVNLLNILRGN